MSQIPYSRVKLARDSARPTGLDYITNLFPGFLEMHGDRRFADDPAVVGGLAWLNGMPVTVIAIEKATPPSSGLPGISAPPIRRATGRPCA